MTSSSIWILLFSIFLGLLFLLLVVILRATFLFTNRYCICLRIGFCCCIFKIDWETYHRERESLLRLRQLRRQHREQLARVQILTFSQIPGVIPDSHHMGIIISPPSAMERNIRPSRELLTPEQRRNILERILTCRPYNLTMEKSHSEHNGKLENNDKDGIDIDQFNQQLETNDASVDQVSKQEESYAPFAIAIPNHEIPGDEESCAICLDEFLNGELINISKGCQHLFHKECLLGWLDQHDICPCCRSVMVTENDWKGAIIQERILIPHQGI
jgi:Ring finger domain